jgi:hypothetical protein
MNFLTPIVVEAAPQKKESEPDFARDIAREEFDDARRWWGRRR